MAVYLLAWVQVLPYKTLYYLEPKVNKNQSQIANLITVGSRFAPVTKGNQQKKSNQVQLLQITMKQENGKSYEEDVGPHPQFTSLEHIRI